MHRLVTSLDAVAHANESAIAASAKTEPACSTSAKQTTAFRPTTSLDPLMAGTKRSWMTLTPAANHY